MIPSKIRKLIRPYYLLIFKSKKQIEKEFKYKVRDWNLDIEFPEKEKFRLFWNRRVACLGTIALSLIAFRIIRILTIVEGLECNNNIIGLAALFMAIVSVFMARRFFHFEIKIADSLKKVIIPCLY